MKDSIIAFAGNECLKIKYEPRVSRGPGCILGVAPACASLCHPGPDPGSEEEQIQMF